MIMMVKLMLMTLMLMMMMIMPELALTPLDLATEQPGDPSSSSLHLSCCSSVTENLRRFSTRKDKSPHFTSSPSVDENLSEGLMNFGSFPLATSGEEVFSQSHSALPSSLSPGFRDFFRAGPAPRAIFRAGVSDGECYFRSPRGPATPLLSQWRG